MRIQKHGASIGQRIDVRCPDLRMTVQAADPVILVIDSNEQNVGTAFRSRGNSRTTKQQRQTDRDNAGNRHEGFPNSAVKFTRRALFRRQDVEDQPQGNAHAVEWS